MFAEALSATAKHRGTTEQIADVSGILHNIEESPELKIMWDKYRKQFAYAADIEYGQIIHVLRTLLSDPGKRIPKLLEYAEPLRVKKIAKDLIGVWL